MKYLKQKAKIPRWIFLLEIIAIAVIYYIYKTYEVSQNPDFVLFNWIVFAVINLILLFWRNE